PSRPWRRHPPLPLFATRTLWRGFHFYTIFATTFARQSAPVDAPRTAPQVIRRVRHNDSLIKLSDTAMRGEMKKLIFVLLGCALVFGGVFGFISFKNRKMAEIFANMPRPPIPVTATKASEQGWSRTVTAIGVLEAIHGVDISPEVS